MMNCNHTDFLLNGKTLRITLYLSLVIGHLIFAALYPESITTAACGFAFFAALVVFHLRPASPHPRHAMKIEKTARANK